jgi:predicted transcriptional regulator
MDAREVIHHLCNLGPRSDGDPETVLNSIRETPMNRSAIAETYSTPRKTIRNVLRPFETVDFVIRTDEGLQVTGAGDAFLQAFERTLSSLSRAQLEFLSATPNRRLVLQQLREGPARKSELAADTDLPSRVTIQRIMGDFTERGWTARDSDGCWVLTESGGEALEAYETFLVTAEQSISKAALLCGLGEVSKTIPLGALVDAECIEESRGDPHALLQTSLDLAGVGSEPVARISAIVPIFSTVLYDEYLQLVDRGTRFRVVCDHKTATRLHEADDLPYLDLATDTLSVEMRFYPESLDFGIATFDGTVMLTAYPDGESHPTAIVSSNPELVAWANDLVEEFWGRADAPTDPPETTSSRRTDA